MIVRNVDLNDLSKFDFYNDGKDTVRYLANVGRVDESLLLHRSMLLWSSASRQSERDAIDAARYRWLRRQHWNTGKLAVVVDPKNAVRLGHDCPSNDRLDAAIDEAMKKEQT